MEENIKHKHTGEDAPKVKHEDLDGSPFFPMLVQSGITALAGGGQAGAVQIVKPIVEISVCATAQDSVLLPPIIIGTQILIINHGAESCDVFPYTGQMINEAAVNTAKTLAANASLLCSSWDGTNWECLTLAR